MDENVVFKPTNTPSSQPSSSDIPQTSPSPSNLNSSLLSPQINKESSSTPPSPPSPPSQASSLSESPLPKPPVSSQRNVLGLLLKIGIATLAVAIIVIFIFKFIVPLFGTSKANKVNLIYWGLWEDKNTMQKIIDDFQREYPNITVTYIKKDIRQYRQSLVTQISNGTGPDIYRYHNSWVGMMKSYLSPLSADVITPDEFKNLYFPVIQRDLTRNGALYGIPLMIDTLSLFINEELFEAGGNTVPRTWDEFVRVAKNLVVKDSEGNILTAGAAMGTYDNITHAPDIIALLFAQNGTNFDNFQATKVNASQALQFYTAFAKGEGSVWNDRLDPSVVAFAKGNLAMYFGYSWDIFTIQSLNKDLRFSVHPVPNLPGRKITIASYWVEGVSAKSKHQKEAMLFMKHLAKKDTLQKLYTEIAKTRSFGELYPRKDLAATLKNNRLVYPFLAQAEFAISSYFASDTYDEGINMQMNKYLGDAVRSIQRNSSAESATDTLAQGVQQVISKYGQ